MEDLKSFLGKTGFEHELREPAAHCRRLRRRLDDRPVPGGEAGGDLVREKIDGRVERRDGEDGPDRGTEGERGRAGSSLPSLGGQELA